MVYVFFIKALKDIEYRGEYLDEDFFYTQKIWTWDLDCCIKVIFPGLRQDQLYIIREVLVLGKKVIFLVIII